MRVRNKLSACEDTAILPLRWWCQVLECGGTELADHHCIDCLRNSAASANLKARVESIVRNVKPRALGRTRQWALTALVCVAIAGPIGVGHRFPYAVNRDGSRFLVYVNERTGVLPSLTVVMNWPALLER